MLLLCKMKNTRKIRAKNRTTRKQKIIPRYTVQIIRGGGNFTGASCSPDPVLDSATIQTPEFKTAFMTPLSDTLNFIVDEREKKQGSYNSVVPAECRLNANRVIYAFRRSTDELPELLKPLQRRKRDAILKRAYDELATLVKLSDLNLAPKVYMAGIYDNRIYQVMEYVIPFSRAMKMIISSDKPQKEKIRIMHKLFNSAYDLYSEIGEKTTDVFIDIKPGNMGVRGDPLTGDFQVVLFDTDNKYILTEPEFNSAVDYAYTQYYGDRAPIQFIRGLFMVFLFASISYIDMVRSGNINYLRTNYGSVIDMVIGSINLYPEGDSVSEHKQIITHIHNFLYRKNGTYKSIIDKYIMDFKDSAIEVGIPVSDRTIGISSKKYSSPTNEKIKGTPKTKRTTREV